MHSCVQYLHHFLFDPISLREQARISFIVFVPIAIVVMILIVAMPEDHDGF